MDHSQCNTLLACINKLGVVDKNVGLDKKSLAIVLGNHAEWKMMYEHFDQSNLYGIHLIAYSQDKYYCLSDASTPLLQERPNVSRGGAGAVRCRQKDIIAALDKIPLPELPKEASNQQTLTNDETNVGNGLADTVTYNQPNTLMDEVASNHQSLMNDEMPAAK